jgi:hypothetical protein
MRIVLLVYWLKQRCFLARQLCRIAAAALAIPLFVSFARGAHHALFLDELDANKDSDGELWVQAFCGSFFSRIPKSRGQYKS